LAFSENLWVISGLIPTIQIRIVSVAIREMMIWPSGIECSVTLGFFNGVVFTAARGGGDFFVAFLMVFLVRGGAARVSVVADTLFAARLAAFFTVFLETVFFAVMLVWFLPWE
jgi:hypothetical protein